MRSLTFVKILESGLEMLINCNDIDVIEVFILFVYE